MELKDKDLISVQETRNLLIEAEKAQRELSRMDQTQIDRIVKAISDAGAAHRRYRLQKRPSRRPVSADGRIR